MNARHAWLGVAVLVALAAAYALGRSHAPIRSSPVQGADPSDPWPVPDAAPTPSTPPSAVQGTALPPPGAPLAESFAALRARAGSGDARAATRLFRDLDRCRRLRADAWRAAGASGALAARDTAGMSLPQLRAYQQSLDAMALRQQQAREEQRLCAGVDDAMLAATVDSIAQAARLGDADARACYLARGPLLDARRLLERPDALRLYRDQARTMIEAGLEAGDWRVVDLLRQAQAPDAPGLLAGLLPSDPVQYYRYLALYRLAAEPHRMAKLDRELAAAAAMLEPGQAAESDAWAQRMLRERFSSGASTATTSPGWDPCAF